MSNRLGIDWWDLTIHVFVTIMLAVALSEGVGMNEDFALPAVFGGSALLLAFRRKLALKKQALGDGYSTGEMAAERIADLEARIADLEMAQTRVAELEERMDFSERLLTQQSNESRVSGRE
jgi:hypothetical protein